MNRTKVLFILPDLKPGGAEKIVINIANNLPREEYECSVVLLNYSDHDFSMLLSKHIRIWNLKLSRFRSLILKPWIFINVIRRIKPHVIFSAYGELNPLVVLFSFFFRNIRFVARETSIPSLRYSNHNLNFFTRIFYRLYDVIVVQSEDMYRDLSINYGIQNSILKLIPNPIDTKQINNLLQSSNLIPRNETAIRILYVGSISEQKGIIRILDYFQNISNILSEIELFIVGDGPLCDEVRSYVSTLNNRFSIFIYPFDVNPYRYMASSDFLIIASDYEGFPNVGLEANYCGVPVLLWQGTKGGAKELIKENLNGMIIDFESQNLHYFEQDFDKYAIKEHVSTIYSIESVIKEYQKLF